MSNQATFITGRNTPHKIIIFWSKVVLKSYKTIWLTSQWLCLVFEGAGQGQIRGESLSNVCTVLFCCRVPCDGATINTLRKSVSSPSSGNSGDLPGQFNSSDINEAIKELWDGTSVKFSTWEIILKKFEEDHTPSFVLQYEMKMI